MFIIFQYCLWSGFVSEVGMFLDHIRLVKSLEENGGINVALDASVKLY